MGVWDWVWDYDERVRAENDETRIRLLDLFQEACDFEDIDPSMQLAKLEEGRQLAQQLGEAPWIVFFEHWRLQAILSGLGDYQKGMEQSVRAAVEARKPTYATTPQRICVHYDLITAFVGADPQGHAAIIRDALDYMQAQVTPDLDCRFCLQNLRATFLVETGRYAEAETALRTLFDLADDAPADPAADHHRLRGTATLCHVYYRRDEWDRLREISRQGELECREDGEQKSKLPEFIVWRAVTAAQSGADAEAARLLRQALRRERELPYPVAPVFYEVAAEAYLKLGLLAEALGVVDAQLARIAGNGRYIHEVRARIRRCQILKMLGRPITDEAAAASAIAHQTKNPTPWLTAIADLEQSPSVD